MYEERILAYLGNELSQEVRTLARMVANINSESVRYASKCKYLNRNGIVVLTETMIHAGYNEENDIYTRYHYIRDIIDYNISELPNYRSLRLDFIQNAGPCLLTFKWPIQEFEFRNLLDILRL